MIATHDSLTYLRPRLWVMRLLSGLWRTQTKTVAEQKVAGARYFDIRVRRQGGKWRCCHGLVDLCMSYGSLASIAHDFRGYLLRIVLERGDDKEFSMEARELMGIGNVDAVIVKHGWKVLKESCRGTVDLSYVPWDTGKGFWHNLRNFRFDTIRRHALRHNGAVTEAMKRDMDTVYYMDML